MKNVADIYPLTPVQLGMLFHTLHQAQASGQNQPRAGTYVNQFTCLLTGEVQPVWFRQAWERTIARHPVLRTAVLWEGLDEPLQVVRETVEMPWQQLDWRAMTEAEGQFSQAEAVSTQALDDFLQRDRTQGFDLSQAPALRLALIRLSEKTYQFVWSNHHLLYDGWSLLLIWQDVLTTYAAIAKNIEPALQPVRPFRDYIAWQRQQPASAKAFWQQQLHGLIETTPLPAARSGYDISTRPYRQQSQKLSSHHLERLSHLARQHRLTLNTLVQGAWALLLHHYSDGTVSADSSAQVTYGSVVSGRPAALSGVELMVGLFINTLPVTVPIDPEQPLIPWLRARQQQLLAIREYEATSLADIQRWSKLPQGAPLFESIVAFENITAEATPDLSFTISEQQYLEQSNYPLALLVFPEQAPQKSLDLKLLYDVDRFEDASIAQLLAHLEQLLLAFVDSPEARLTELPRLTAAEQQLLTGTRREYPQDRCIHQLIEAQV